MSRTYRRDRRDDRVAARTARASRERDYLRFLETYNYERFVADGRIGPLAAFARSKPAAEAVA